MKVSFRPLLLATAAILAPQVASSSILVAVDDFDPAGQVGAPNNASNYVAPGFTATIAGGNLPSNGSGSTDGTYGPTNLQPFAIAESQNGNAWVVGGSTPDTATLTLSANAGTPSTQLFFLLYDAANSTGRSNLSISYQINLGPVVALAPAAPAEIDDIDFNSSADYGDYSIPLTNVFLAGGDSIKFLFSSATGDSIYLDNIAITPEPGSLLALGCLMGGGAFFRSRRRRA